MRHRDPPRRIGDAACDFALEIVGQETGEDKAPAIPFRVRRVAGDADGCKLLTAKHAMESSLTVTCRTGPSPSSGNRVSNTPFRLYKHWIHEGGIATPSSCTSRAASRREAACATIRANCPTSCRALYPCIC
jgi:hypothetical protein